MPIAIGRKTTPSENPDSIPLPRTGARFSPTNGRSGRPGARHGETNHFSCSRSSPHGRKRTTTHAHVSIARARASRFRVRRQDGWTGIPWSSGSSLLAIVEKGRSSPVRWEIRPRMDLRCRQRSARIATDLSEAARWEGDAISRSTNRPRTGPVQGDRDGARVGSEAAREEVVRRVLPRQQGHGVDGAGARGRSQPSGSPAPGRDEEADDEVGESGVGSAPGR